MDIIELMKRELIRRKYSYRTIKSYVFCFNQFLKKCHKEPRKMNKSDVTDYLDSIAYKSSASTLNLHLQSIKFALEQILNKRFFVKMPFSKVPKKLPIFLTKDEVVRLFEVIKNRKHSLMIRLMYSAGLRVSELVNLKIMDFEFERDYGWVRNGKGGKDRLFLIAKKLKSEILDFIKNENLSNESFLFSGLNGSISTKSVYLIVKRATKIAKINKKIHPHTLRHSFATHLIEDSYPVSTVQSLLGHNSIETTMVYIHMTKPKLIDVESPYDKLCSESFK